MKGKREKETPAMLARMARMEFRDEIIVHDNEVRKHDELPCLGKRGAKGHH